MTTNSCRDILNMRDETAKITGAENICCRELFDREMARFVVMQPGEGESTQEYLQADKGGCGALGDNTEAEEIYHAFF